MKKQILLLLILLLSLSAGLRAAPLQGLGRAAQLPPVVPAHPLPLWVGPSEVKSQMQLLFIDDQLANNQYVTTLASTGTHLPGGQVSAIFGARQRIGVNRRGLTWYPHAVDRKIPVQQIFALQPHLAFEGVSDRRGNRISFNQGQATLPSPEYVNLAFSDLAFSHFAKVGLGSVSKLSYKEKLQDGSEREISTTLAKAAILTLQRPKTASCRPESVNGEIGQICSIRSVQVQRSTSVNGGDLRFIARAKGISPVTQFRVGQQWARLGESIAVAAFARSQAIEVFVPQATPAVFNMIGKTLEMGFYSPSRLALGDRFNLLSTGASALPIEKEPQLSRLELLQIDDQVSNNQYLTTLGSSSQQAIYGVRHPQVFGGGSRPAAWYMGKLTKSAAPAVVLPIELFNGFVDDLGLPSEQGENPRLSDSGFDVLSKIAVGDSVMLTYGQSMASSVRSNIIKGGRLTLGAAPPNSCRRSTVDNTLGTICTLRTVNSQLANGSGGDIQFRVDAKGQAPGVRIRVANIWRGLSEPIPVAEFAKSQAIEVFTPANTATRTAKSMYRMFFYSGSKAARGDRFVVGAETKGDIYITQIASVIGKASVIIFLNKKTTGSENFYASISRGTASTNIYDPKKAKVLFNPSLMSMVVDLSSPGKAIPMPVGTNSINVNIPVSGLPSVETYFYINADIGNALGSSQRYTKVIIPYHTGGGGGGGTKTMVSSVSSPSVQGGAGATFTTQLSRAAVSKDQLFVKLSAGTAASGTDFDERNVGISFDLGSDLTAQNLTGGKVIAIPVGAKVIRFSVPSKANLTSSAKQFTLSADMGTSLGANKKTGTATIAAAVAPVVSMVSSPRVIGGKPAAFVVDLNQGAIGGNKLFVQLSAGTGASTADFDETKVDITFDVGGDLKAQNLSGGKAIPLAAGAQKITLSVPTSTNLSSVDKLFKLEAEVGTALTAAKKTGIATIEKTPLPVITLSITPMAGDSTSGELGDKDAKLTYKVKVDASNYTGRHLRKDLFARTLRTGSAILVSVDGPVGKGDACSFLIENSPQAGKHVLIPAYLEYAAGSGIKKIFHGCRNEVIDTSAGQWNWQIDSTAQTLKGELDLALGFVLSDSASLYTMEDSFLKWVGSAKARGNVTVRAEWNASSRSSPQ